MNEKLLRFLMKCPLIWRLAAKKAAVLPHSLGNCIACVGLKRIMYEKHVAFMVLSGQVICRNCNLPIWKWNKKPVCLHKKPPIKPTLEPQPRYTIIPTDF